MKLFQSIHDELELLINQWEPKLLDLSSDILNTKRNSQGRTVKQIIGHMVDSASNNLHRIVHLQYQESPLDYPNYATHGNNDRWIAIQNYQEEDWHLLVNVWKYSNLHYAWAIQFIDTTKLANKWNAGDGQQASLEAMVLDFPRHFRLHMQEIEDLVEGKSGK